MKKILLIIFSFFLLSSCSFHMGAMLNSASLGQANFNYVKKGITGSAKVTYIFGIGGNARKRIAGEARKDLLAQNPLSSNQALANITTDVKSSFILGTIYSTMTYTITADIVEFKK